MTGPEVTRIFECRVPHGQADPDALIASLQAQLARAMFLHPQLRGAQFSASDGDLVMTLRVVARDRSNVAAKARLIASRLVNRAKLNPHDAKLILVGVPSDGRSAKS